MVNTWLNSSVESGSTIVPSPSATAAADAVPRLEALGHAPHQQQQQQARQHVGPQPDQIDHLVARMVRGRQMPVGPGFCATRFSAS